MIRLSATTALLAGAMAWTTAPQPDTTNSVTRYRVEQVAKSIIDQSSVGGPEQTVNSKLVGLITVTLQDTTGGQTMTVVLDSLAVENDALPLSAETLAALQDSARGAAWHALVGPDGRISALETDSEHPLLQPLESILNAFFPRVKPGTKPGQHWTDTLNLTSESAAASTKSTVVTEYQAEAEEPHAGQPALKVVGAFTGTTSGVTQSPQGELNLSGTSTGNGTHYIGRDGRYLGGSTESSTKVIVDLPLMGATIPVTTSATLTVTPL